MDYSSKAKSYNVRDLLVTKNTVHTCVHEAVICVYTLDLLRHVPELSGTWHVTWLHLKMLMRHYLFETYAYHVLQYIPTL